jgi:NTE family protein
MLAALYEHGVRPDLIVGLRGAVNGAFIARPPHRATATELATSWCATRRNDVFPLRPRRDLPVPRRERPPRLGARFASPRQAHGCTSSRSTWSQGEELLFSAGPVVEGVLASAAVRGVLPPVRWGERWLVDGSVANNTPISHAVDLGARTICVLPTGDACALPAAPA